MLPKVEDAGHVHFIDNLLNQLEWKLGLEGMIGLELQVETARGMENSAQVAAASPRNRTLIFGPVDFAADMRLPGFGAGDTRPDYPGDLWHYFLARVVVAARAKR